MSRQDQAVILVADDSEDDLLLIRRAFKKANISNPLHTVQSGDDAIAYLSGERKYANRAEYPLPDLFLLDLKMPGINGFEVLRWLRQHPGLQPLRVVVLTSSDHIRDVNLAYVLGANSFMLKPMDFEDFVELSRVLHEHWLFKSKAPETSRDRRSSSPSQPHRAPGATDRSTKR
jgi:CheY-like chemotaxis protein